MDYHLKNNTQTLKSKISVKDKHIISNSFRLMCSGIENVHIRDHLNKDLYYNFYSTSVGDNIYVNPRAQFSPATDPRAPRVFNSKEGSLGTQFKRIYEDNQSYLTLTVGVAEFTGLLTFINNMFDPVAAVMANKGRAPTWTFYVGQAIGSIAFWPMQLYSISMQFMDFLLDTPRNQFYYVKPAMGTYLGCVHNLFNDIVVSLGYAVPVLPSHAANKQNTTLYGNFGDVWNIQDQVSRLHTLFPNSINSDGTIDVVKLLMKGPRKYRFFLDAVKKLDDNSQITTLQEKQSAIERILGGISFSNEVLTGDGLGVSDLISKELAGTGKVRGAEEGAFPELASAYTNEGAYNNPNTSTAGLTGAGGQITQTGQTAVAAAQAQIAAGMNTTGQYGVTPQTNPNEPTRAPTTATPSSVEDIVRNNSTSYEDNPDDRSWMGNVFDQIRTGFNGGMDAITFRVEHQGSVSDSFSSSTTSSPMAEKFNSMVKSANDFKFDVAGGKVLQSDILQGAVNLVTDAVTGLAAGISIANIPLALANNSYIKIPDHWSDSQTSLHTESYQMKFHCTYAHPYCQLTQLWLPFCLLLPLFAPASAGGSAYTTPFLVKAFSQSRQIIRIGIVSSASIVFGEGPMGWTKDRKPLNMTVNLNIMDLDKTLTIPITKSMGAFDLTNPAAFAQNVLSDAGKYNDYISRLTGVEYLDTVLRYARLNRRLTQAVNSVGHTFSSSNIAATVNQSIIRDVAGIFTQQLRR